MELPPPPDRSFASDNASGAHPAVIDAIAAANTGHALAYGEDHWTTECVGRFHDLFGTGTALLTFNGTGANIAGLATMLRPADAVVCTTGAHINVDETGAAERILGVKLIDLPSTDGKLTVDDIESVTWMFGNPHHVQPGVVSITQSTELGTVYRPDEIAAICDRAHQLGMLVHVDGARLANAIAALTPEGGNPLQTLRATTVDAGVDVVTFGGTKNGLVGGEAVILLNDELSGRAEYLRKAVTQLPSKMRFIAAQFLALLDDDLWVRNAHNSNSMAVRLHHAVAELPGVDVAPPQVNSLFPVLDPALIEPLRAWSFVWDWDVARHQVRWMTAWDTTEDDVNRFAAGVTSATRELLANY